MAFPQPPDVTSQFSQHRRWLKTRFAMAHKQLDYSVESGNDAALQKKIPWDTIGGRTAYFKTTESDRELRWICFVLTALAAFATFRGGPQPLTFLLYLGVTITLLAGVALTRRLRCVGYTGIPATGINILVLDDDQHDAIVSEIETRRKTALLKAAKPAPGLTIRTWLRRLRWLAENDVLTRDEVLRRQQIVLPDEPSPLVAPPMPDQSTQTVTQRRLGTRITVELQPDRLAYSRATLFNGSEGFDVLYRDMPEASVFHETDHQYELTGLVFGWCAIGILAWMTSVSAKHPADYYVGGIGLKRAITDFGPALLAMVTSAAVISWFTRLKIARPWPGVVLLRDRQFDDLIAAIEQRRLTAKRLLALPDPLLTLNEQIQVLDELREAETISDEEYRYYAAQAEGVCDNPALDLPVMDIEPAPQGRAPH